MTSPSPRWRRPGDLRKTIDPAEPVGVLGWEAGHADVHPDLPDIITLRRQWRAWNGRMNRGPHQDQLEIRAAEGCRRKFR